MKSKFIVSKNLKSLSLALPFLPLNIVVRVIFKIVIFVHYDVDAFAKTIVVLF